MWGLTAMQAQGMNPDTAKNVLSVKGKSKKSE